MQKLTHETMLEITKHMPMKLISIDREIAIVFKSKIIVQAPYLERYYAGTFADGSDLWFHHFLTNDAERHLHSHPFEFKTVMLCGGYTEEYLREDGAKDHRITLPYQFKFGGGFVKYSIINAKLMMPDDCQAGREISVFDWHRIAAVEPDTWTMMIVKPKRLPFWFFKDDNGETISMKASPKEWWHDFKTRGEQQ